MLGSTVTWQRETLAWALGTRSARCAFRMSVFRAVHTSNSVVESTLTYVHVLSTLYILYWMQSPCIRCSDHVWRPTVTITVSAADSVLHFGFDSKHKHSGRSAMIQPSRPPFGGGRKVKGRASPLCVAPLRSLPENLARWFCQSCVCREVFAAFAGTLSILQQREIFLWRGNRSFNFTPAIGVGGEGCAKTPWPAR